MKVEDILRMDVEEFIKELTLQNLSDAEDLYCGIVNALSTYKEGAQLSGVEYFLEPNEYIELNYEMKEDIENQLKIEYEE